MERMKISIIVPVYQAEKYLSSCLDCLLRQNISGYEIICVDDGSTDHSAQIIQAYQEKNEKIIYCYKENGGVSSARNKGLELAQGKYVMFVDSDDKIKKNSLQYLYETAEQQSCSILVFGGKMDRSLHAPEWMRMGFYTRNISYNKFEPEILYEEPGSQPSVCNKLFKRECLGTVRFSEKISIAEDMTFLFQVLPKAGKISFVKKRVYQYRISNTESAMHRTSEYRIRYMENHMRAATEIVKFWLQEDILKKNDKKFVDWLTSFLRGPYKLLTEEELKVFTEQVEHVYKLVGSQNLLLVPESVGESSFPLERIMRILRRDVEKFGWIGGLENLLYKFLFRR